MRPRFLTFSVFEEDDTEISVTFETNSWFDIDVILDLSTEVHEMLDCKLNWIHVEIF